MISALVPIMGAKRKICRKLYIAEASYLAGIVDGEGCVYSYKTKKNSKKGVWWSCGVTVTNTDRKLIEFIVRKTGIGCVITRKYRSTKGFQGLATVYRWQASARQASSFLAQIVPFMRVKKQLAIFVIRLVELKTKSSNKGAYQLAKQNRLGKAIQKINRKLK